MTLGKNTVSGEELRSYVERIEAVRVRKKECSDDEAAIMAEARALGFVPAIIRGCLKARAQKPHDRQENEALFDMYMHALGMGDEPPLFRQMNALSADPTSRESVLEALKKFAPSYGDIVLRTGGQPVRVYRDKDGEVRVEDFMEAPARQTRGENYAREDKPKREVPDVDADGAEQLGREAAKANRPVIDNPFPFGDERQARFDAGWRQEAGSDGMGPDEE